MAILSNEEAARQARALGRLVPRAIHPDGGFGWLDPANRLAEERGVETWITCRMTHVAALEHLRGEPGMEPAMAAGLAGLTGSLRDDRFGGWFAEARGTGGTGTAKVAYAHAFVVLAATSLTAAGQPGGRELLAEALAVFGDRFWDEDTGMAVEQYDRDWGVCDGYRGINANMHTVEAMLAAHDVLGDPVYLDRALRILDTTVNRFARPSDWRLVEHFDDRWQPLNDYNVDRPDDKFRPYGVTIGHLFEWGRLAINGRSAALRAGREEPAGLLDGARGLFEAAYARGWHADGADGFVYTTDFADRPVVRQRLHWVACEALAAASALYDVTGEDRYLHHHRTIWDYVVSYLIDTERGGWIHELAPDNTPSDTIWWGKPDLYHAYQCLLVPLLPGMVSFAGAVRGPR